MPNFNKDIKEKNYRPVYLMNKYAKIPKRNRNDALPALKLQWT